MWGFGNGAWAQSKQLFADQFEPHGDERFVYRENQKGPPIPVTAAERDRFIDDYARRLRYCTWGMMAVLTVFLGVTIWWTFQTDSDPPEVLLYVGLIAIVVAFVASTLWIRGAPTRELQRRSPVGRERTAAEMRALYLSKTSYGQLAGAAAFGGFLIFIRATKENAHSGWHWIFLVLGGALVLLAAIQAFRKWRFESEHPDDAPY